MIPTDDKSLLLKGFLGNLPETAAGQLARAVEVDRLMEGHELPHDAILMGLRPALRRSARTQTPLRLFCQPFEDLLVSGGRKQKQKAVIPRASVVPVWNWLGIDLLPDETRNYFRDAKALILAGKPDLVLERARIFWKEAGAAMRAALASETGLAAAEGRLSKDEIADAREIALLLTEAGEMLRIQERLPKAVPHLTEELLWQLRESYDALIARNPDAAPFVAVVAMNRLQRPWEALRLPLMVSRQTRDVLISKTDMGLVGEILLARMDAMKAVILAARHPVSDVEILIAQVVAFADLSSALVKEVEMRRDGEWGRRLLKDRAAIGAVMDGFMERAVKEFAQALPMHKGSADFSRPTTPERRSAALNYTRLVAGTRHFAAAASFAAKQSLAQEETANHLRRYVENGVRDLRGCSGEKRALVESQLAYCAELAALLFSGEEAELIRRRVKAAA